MKELFAPYVESVFQLAAPLMLFSGTVHDDLRACSIACVPPLIDSINATGDKKIVKQLFDFSIKQLFTALSQEVEMDVVKTVAQSIKETILAACRPAGSTADMTDFSAAVPMLDAQSLQFVFQQLVVAMRGSLQRRPKHLHHHRSPKGKFWRPNVQARTGLHFSLLSIKIGNRVFIDFEWILASC